MYISCFFLHLPRDPLCLHYTFKFHEAKDLGLECRNCSGCFRSQQSAHNSYEIEIVDRTVTQWLWSAQFRDEKNGRFVRYFFLSWCSYLFGTSTIRASAINTVQHEAAVILISIVIGLSNKRIMWWTYKRMICVAFLLFGLIVENVALLQIKIQRNLHVLVQYFCVRIFICAI